MAKIKAVTILEARIEDLQRSLQEVSDARDQVAGQLKQYEAEIPGIKATVRELEGKSIQAIINEQADKEDIADLEARLAAAEAKYEGMSDAFQLLIDRLVDK